jgi:hypothetical protein
MDSRKPDSPLKSKASSRMIRGLASAALWAASVLALSFVIVWPLWRLATSSRRAYSILFAAALFALAAAALLRKLRSRVRARTRRRPSA